MSFNNNRNLSELFNIPALAYKEALIEDLPLTVRQKNALLTAGCKTLECLLNYSIEDLYNIKNLGRGSIEGIVDYITKLDIEKGSLHKKIKTSVDVSAFRRYYAMFRRTGKTGPGFRKQKWRFLLLSRSIF